MSFFNNIANSLVGVWEHEPAVVIGVVNALMILAVSFGLPLTGEQKTAVDGLLAVVAGAAIRSQVTPVAQLPGPKGTIVRVDPPLVTVP